MANSHLTAKQPHSQEACVSGEWPRHEYKKLVGKEDPVPTIRPVPERLRALEQLKTDDLISEEEYHTKRKEILGEL
jgi:hypothetical protein